MSLKFFFIDKYAFMKITYLMLLDAEVFIHKI